MSKCIFLVVVIILALVPFKAYPIEAFLKNSSPADANQSSDTVINVILEKMDEDYLYATDGNKYPIMQETKVIYNKHSITKMRIAELHFNQGQLMIVIIK